MYKVLIVDDEVLVRVGLKTTIDWEENGFTIVAEASNGEQGYEQYKKHLPDVIITDIKMPKRDGLWLIEQIRKENQLARILILTVHDDFSYARKALKVDVDDYILKSEIEDEELVLIMQTVKKNLDMQNNIRKSDEKELKNKNDIKRSIFSDMIKADFNLDTTLLDRCARIEFPVSNSKFAFMSILINHNKNETNTDASLILQMNNAVMNLILDLLAERMMEYIYTNQVSRCLMFLSSQTLNEAELGRLLHSANNSAKQYFDCSLSVIYTDVFDKMDDAEKIYKNFSDKELVLFYKYGKRFLANANEISFHDPNVFNMRKEHNKKVIEAVSAENIDAVKKLICELEAYFKENNVNPKLVQIFFSNLMNDIFSNFGLFLENSEVFRTYEHYHNRIENADFLQSITGLLDDFTEKLINEIRQTRYSSSTILINRAISFIQYHYDEKISLDDVAEKLHLSKHYLCSAFKKATGENMSLYINKLRIEKAKSLLLEPNGRVKEIYEEVGYSNQQYFSKVFKRITGMTVMEYKESMIPKQ
jgi:two-component system response regulator YesN